MNIKDLKVVRSKLWEARTNWFNIGVELGVEYTALQEIQQKTSQGDPSECFTKLLAGWLKSSNPPATWNSILKALRSPPVNLTQLADSTEENFLDGESQSDIGVAMESKCDTSEVNNTSLLSGYNLLLLDKHNNYCKIQFTQHTNTH